jgi:predicted MFS family arabinose efflux permease
MKIASDWYDKGLGRALGYLIGALVLGTAFPHLLKNRDFNLPWESVLYFTSLFALTGGLIMFLFVGDGPFRKASGKFQWTALSQIFNSKKFRQSAFGYFGHMWELYTFWGFVPVMLHLYNQMNDTNLNVPLLSFFIIACGCLSSVAGGYFSQTFGSARVAALALFISGICCVASIMFYTTPPVIFLSLLFVWGLAVVPDSPQFSTLAANYAPQHLRGTALTIYNSIGFLIAIFSLFITDYLYHTSGIFESKNSFIILSLGALLGLPSIIRLIRSHPTET